VHVGADRATYSRNVQVVTGLTSSQRVVEIRLVPCRRGIRAGAVHHVSGQAHPLPLSGNMDFNGAHAGPLGPPVNDVTQRFMLIHSFLETQRTARTALTTIHHFSRSVSPSFVTAAPPVAGAGRGRGVALLGTRRPQTQVWGCQYYATSHGHHDRTLFKSMCGVSPVELDAIAELARERVERAMDPRMHRSVEMNELQRPRRRVCSAIELIFLTLVLLRGRDEGALPIRTVAFNIGVSPATVSNYFSHCILALHDTFMLACPIVWPSAAERWEMEGLFNGVPSGIIFVDGTKVRRWRPTDTQEQLRAYDGHHYCHCFSVLVWVDVYRLIVRVDASSLGACHDRRLFTRTGPHLSPASYFDGDQHAIGDTGFIGPSRVLVCPFGRNAEEADVDQGEWNPNIRKSRIRNEWGIWDVKNRSLVSLGRWSYGSELFASFFELCAML